MTAVDTQRKQLSRELVADLRRLDAALARSSDDIAAAVFVPGSGVRVDPAGAANAESG